MSSIVETSWNFKLSIVLRAHQLEAMSVIWRKLFPRVITGVVHKDLGQSEATARGVILADEPGLGKTQVALSLTRFIPQPYTPGS